MKFARKKVREQRPAKRAKSLPGLMRNTGLQAVVVLAMCSLLAFVIVFHTERPKPLPTFDLVVGEPAADDIKATHSFSIVQVDQTGLEERRAEAAAAVLPIWEFDEDLAASVDGRIEGLFGQIRRELKDFAEDFANAQIPEGTGGPVEAVPGADPLAQLSEQDLLFFVTEHLAEINSHLGTRLTASQVLPISRSGFSTELERPLREMVAEILTKPLVRSMADLANPENGLTLVRLHDDVAVGEELVEDFSNFWDIESAAEEVRRQVGALTVGTPEERQAVAEMATEIIAVSINTYFNRGGTRALERQAAAAVVPPREVVHYVNDQFLVREGEDVQQDHVEAVEAMIATGSAPSLFRANEVMIGGVIYVLIVLIGILMYGVRFIRQFSPSLRDLACMTVVLLVMVSVTRAGLSLADLIGGKSADFPIAAVYAALPFAAGAMLIRVVLNAESAVIFAIIFSMLVALMMPEHPIFPAYVLVGSLTGTGAIETVRTRMSLFRGGIIVGFVNLAFAVALGLLGSNFVSIQTAQLALLAFAGGITVAIMVSALLPVVESVFHYISDFKLLELANPDHPALRKLLLHAPGSYHHSMMVASLVEAACKAVGAHALLGRVGSYYHDIGKTKNPQYFAENQKGKNPHDKLKPHMSALIIKSHVKDGVDIAIQHGLPEEIIRFIQEHHGTSLIEFFYHRAKEAADPGLEEVNEKDFRYAGPKPQTPETAICMLADGIEAASRAMQEATPARLQGLVQKMINRAFIDGQLDECDLTLRDLDAIARAFITILLSIYHQRPEYPDKKKETANKIPRVQAPQENTNGRGDSDSGDAKEAEDKQPAAKEEGPATLRRLGID